MLDIEVKTRAWHLQDNFPYLRSEIPRQREDWFQRRGIFKEAPLHFTSQYKSDSLSMCSFKRTYFLLLLLLVIRSSIEVIVLFLCSNLDIFSPLYLSMYYDEGMYCHNVRFPGHYFLCFCFSFDVPPLNFYSSLSSPRFPAGTHTK